MQLNFPINFYHIIPIRNCMGINQVGLWMKYALVFFKFRPEHSYFKILSNRELDQQKKLSASNTWMEMVAKFIIIITNFLQLSH